MIEMNLKITVLVIITAVLDIMFEYAFGKNIIKYCF